MSDTSKTTDECRICNEESKKLYQCCPNEDDLYCEECWSQIISGALNTGKSALLLTDKLSCPYCHEPIQRDSLPEETQKKIQTIFSTIPKTKSPKFVEDFNYSYNESNELRNRLTGGKFIFLTQRYYNLLGSCIDIYIQSLMKSDPWNYKEIWLPIKDEPTDDHHDQVNIFTSNDFDTNENGCLILLQGSGVVRPGQWARSCCINESLDIGSMFPYMNKAKEHNLSVIILNPNQTSYVDDEEPNNEEMKNSAETEESMITESTDSNIDSSTTSKTDDKTSATNHNEKENTTDDDDIISFYLSPDSLPKPITKKIPNLSTSREHVLYVYDNILSKCPAKKLYIVAHSAGGDCLMYLLRKRQDDILSKITKIAFTDSVHSVLPLDSAEIKNFLKANAIHFIASDEPMGTQIDYAYDFSQGTACQEVSAGHPKHEYTSGYAVNGVFDFFFPSPNTNDEEIDRTKL